MGETPVVENVEGVPAPQLRPYVRRYTGYRYTELEPGSHLGLPSPYLTTVLSLGPPTDVSVMPDPRQPGEAFGALTGGLHLRPARISYEREMFGLQLDLTPAGARSLLGMPASEMAGMVIDLADAIGGESGRLVERLFDAPGWSSRFGVLDEVLTARLDLRRPAPAPLEHAWALIEQTGGAARVEALADRVGWSRRQLNHRFGREYGLSPKEALRVVRFHRSRRMLAARPDWTLGEVAARCGYFDQSHMAREWNMLAGVPASEWLSAEVLPFFQDALAGVGRY